MPLDSYASCPCGSGKKVKFCCCKDLLSELDKVVRALTGEQFVAALDQATKLIAERGPRAALLALQAETQLSLQQVPESEQTARKLLEIMPHSSVALAILAIADVVHQNVEAAVEHLQQSLEYVDQELNTATASAIATVAQGLLQSGNILAARGHLLLQAGISGGKDEDPVRTLMELNRMEQMPTMLKQDFQYGECPPEAPWHGEFEAAMRSARRGAWLAACESLESLDLKVPGQPAVIRNIAIFRGWLGQNDQAIAAWRRYETLPAVPEDDAVDAEAVCQLLSLDDDSDFLDHVRITHPIRDIDKLMESLLSNSRLEAIPIDPNEPREEGEPPPKGLFRLLDRPMPPSHAGLEHSDLPRAMGALAVYGRQTDREARLQLATERSHRFEEVKTALRQVAGEWIDPAGNEEVVGQVSSVQSALSPTVRFPRDITQERALALLHDQRNSVYSTVWPDLPRKIFNGKCLREAARDPKLRIRALAAILNVELAAEDHEFRQPFDFNSVRRDLGLPLRGTYQVHGQEILRVPVSRWSRVDFAALSDDELVHAFRFVTLKNLRLAMRRSALELVSRPSIADKIDLAEVYRLLVSVSADTGEALEQIDRGRKFSVAKGLSAGPWYLLELQVRLSRFEPAECNQLIKLLTTKYRSEPGINESLYRILVSHGVISPDGEVRATGPAPPANEPAAAPAAEPPGLWTPESSAPRQESKLWLPGMQ